jgi:hypothetical protein
MFFVNKSGCPCSRDMQSSLFNAALSRRTLLILNFHKESLNNKKWPIVQTHLIAEHEKSSSLINVLLILMERKTIYQYIYCLYKDRATQINEYNLFRFIEARSSN